MYCCNRGEKAQFFRLSFLSTAVRAEFFWRILIEAVSFDEV
jgi:hypothetical protein